MEAGAAEDLGLLLEIEDAMPHETTELREAAAAVTMLVLGRLPEAVEGEDAEALTAARSGILNNLANRLSALGRREEALAAAEEAVRIRRELAARRPDAFLPDLARSLGAMGNILRGMERHGEAADAFSEGLRAVTPLFLRLPAAAAQLTMGVARDYLEQCEKAGRAPDPETLGPVLRKLEELRQSAEGEKEES